MKQIYLNKESEFAVFFSLFSFARLIHFYFITISASQEKANENTVRRART